MTKGLRKSVEIGGTEDGLDLQRFNECGRND